MKVINILLTIYTIITNIIIALLVFFIELENEIFIAFFLALGALLLLLIRYCIKVKNERKQLKASKNTTIEVMKYDA